MKQNSETWFMEYDINIQPKAMDLTVPYGSNIKKNKIEKSRNIKIQSEVIGDWNTMTAIKHLVIGDNSNFEWNILKPRDYWLCNFIDY